MHTTVDERLVEIRNFLIIYKFAIEEMKTKLNILSEEFEYMHERNPIESVKSRVKKPKSIMDKLQRKGFDVNIDQARARVHDIAGIRVVCSFVSDIYTIYDLIYKQHDINVIEVKDYLENPKPNGYQSLHMIIEIPVFLSDRTEYVKVEIQIRTLAMDFWASLEHKIHYKFQTHVPSELIEELREAAHIVNNLDQKMETIKEDMHEYKQNFIPLKKE
ncbi:GTP pyrophosphokinase [Texcoconibacillus texcoconensis]|uniref:Putative GTP pyrophosphokinase n=1 Tax=Texcoconibacillus texcoconensis TaxID=1095777 RepID=A0A840QR71_9BACI|nr:GTP pyrophosphokinase family protein [Texcoconibacillus texcoconensis]MBB5173850.1 putative GTP pyrophosphokinase [Texcoconibacillus texcoconensis]